MRTTKQDRGARDVGMAWEGGNNDPCILSAARVFATKKAGALTCAALQETSDALAGRRIKSCQLRQAKGNLEGRGSVSVDRCAWVGAVTSPGISTAYTRQRTTREKCISASRHCNTVQAPPSSRTHTHVLTSRGQYTLFTSYTRSRFMYMFQQQVCAPTSSLWLFELVTASTKAQSSSCSVCVLLNMSTSSTSFLVDSRLSS